MTDADLAPTAARHTRLGVVQLAFRPARPEWLVDPFATPGEDSVFASVPPRLAPKLRELGKRIREAYVGQLRKKIQAVLKQAVAWDIKILVFPEYSLPHELLPDLLAASTEMLIVAGTHVVDRLSRRTLQGLGGDPGLGQAVAPVLGGGELIACVPKMTPSQWEAWLRLDGRWQPVATEVPFSTRGAVLICLDFLRRDESTFGANPLEDCRWIAVPSLTPSRSREDFSKQASLEALRQRRPVLHANAADGGGSTIYAGSEPSETRSFPDGVGRLQSGDEGLLVAEVDLGAQRAGVGTPYDTPRFVTPFAQASLVYDSTETGFRTWVEEVAPLLESPAPAEAIVEELERLLERHQSALANLTGTRARRIERIKQIAPDAYDVEPLRRLAREVVLPSDVLPYPIVVAALAKGASAALQDWMRTDPECAKILGVLQAGAARLLTATLGSAAEGEVDAIASAVLGRQLVARDMYIARLEEAVEEGFDQRFADAKQLFAELKFTEALSAFVEMREKAESLALPKPQLDTRVVRCALNESACFVNLQQPDDAVGVLASIEGRDVSPALRLRIAEHWAIVGDAARARALLPGPESIAANAEDAEAYQLVLHNIEISEGIVPQGISFPATTLARIAALQLEQREFQACYATLQEILRTSPDPIIEINCAVLLSALLFRTLIDDPSEHVLSVPQRIAVLADCRRLFLAGQFDRLPERIATHARMVEWQVADLAGDWSWLGKLPEVEDGAEEGSVRELVASGQFEEARSKVQIEGPPWRSDWFLIKVLASVSRFEEALTGILRLSEQWPGRVPIEYIAAQLLSQAGRHSEATLRARLVFDEFPTLYHRTVLAEQLARSGNYADAWILLDGVDGDGDARILSLLAQVAEQCSLPAAPSYWSKYLEIHPDDPRALMHRVRILAALGRFLDAADEAWALVETQWEQLSLQDIVFCGSIQVHRGAHARSNDPQHEKRIVRCIRAIRERFGAVPLAEEARLHLSTLLGHEIAAEPPIDFRLLIEAGRLKGFSIDDLPAMLRSDSEAQESRHRLYKACAIPIETFCSSSRLRLAELFSRVTTSGAQWSFCSYQDLHGDSALPALSGMEIVVSLPELYLLASLDLLQAIKEALGADGKLVIFAEHFEALAKERQALAEIVSRQRQGQPLDVLQLLSRLPEDANGPTINSTALLGLLTEKGLIDREQEANLRKYVPADDVGSPTLASDARFRIEPFWLGRLRAIGALEGLVQAIGGLLVRHPGDQEGLHAQLEQMGAATRAYELAASLHDQLGAGASTGWVVMPHSADDPLQIGDLPTPFDELFLEPMLDKSRHWAYLAGSPGAVRVTVDAFGASVLCAPELMMEVIKGWRDGAAVYQALATAMRRAQNRTVGIPRFVRLLATGQRRAGILDRLASLGFVDAYDPDDLLELARRFQGLGKTRPRALLRAACWVAASPAHIGGDFARLRVAQTYANAIFLAGCQLPDQTDESLTRAIVASVLDELEYVSAQSGRNTLSDGLMLVALRTATDWKRVGSKTANGMTFDGASPGRRLWQSIADWCGTNRSRERARQRSLGMAWTALDQSSRGEPKEIPVAAMTTAQSWVAPKNAMVGGTEVALVQMTGSDLESLAILSANWKERPLSHFGIAGLDENAIEISYEAMLARGAELLLRGEVQLGDRDAQFIVRDDDGQPKIAVVAPVEALVLRCKSEWLAENALQLASTQGANDGQLSSALRRLANKPRDERARRTYARRAVQGLWRVVRDDPANLVAWAQSLRGDLSGRPRLLDLKRILSEPPESLADEAKSLFDNEPTENWGVATLLTARATRGVWKGRPDVWHLMRLASETPGWLVAATVFTRLNSSKRAEHIQEALDELAESHEVPACRIASYVIFLRVAAAAQPLLSTTTGPVDLRTRLPSLFLSLLEECDANAQKGSLASHEAATMRLCRTTLQLVLFPEQISGLDGVWLTYRTSQWLFHQLAQVAPSLRQEYFEQLATLAPPARDAPDFLDPIAFSPERFNHRLAMLLHALSQSDTVASALVPTTSDAAKEGDEAPELWSPASPGLQAKLAEIASREGDGSFPTTQLDWEGPGNIPDLALFALLRLDSHGIEKLDQSARMRRIAHLPTRPEDSSPLLNFHWQVIASFCASASRLEHSELEALRNFILDLDAGSTGAQWRWVACSSLATRIEIVPAEDLLGMQLSHVADRRFSFICGEYFASLAARSQGEVEIAAQRLVLTCVEQGLDLLRVASALGRAVIRAGETGGPNALNALVRLSREEPMRSDSDVQKLVAALGIEEA